MIAEIAMDLSARVPGSGFWDVTSPTGMSGSTHCAVNCGGLANPASATADFAPSWLFPTSLGTVAVDGVVGAGVVVVGALPSVGLELVLGLVDAEVPGFGVGLTVYVSPVVGLVVT